MTEWLNWTELRCKRKNMSIVYIRNHCLGWTEAYICMAESLCYSSESITALLTGYMCAKLLQLCPTLCNPMDYSLPGSSVHGILQARIMEWDAMPSSRESSQPRDRTQGSSIEDRFFTIWAPREAIRYLFFSFWLTSLCMTDSGSVHFSTNDPISFLFMAEQNYSYND